MIYTFISELLSLIVWNNCLPLKNRPEDSNIQPPAVSAHQLCLVLTQTTKTGFSHGCHDTLFVRLGNYKQGVVHILVN